MNIWSGNINLIEMSLKFHMQDTLQTFEIDVNSDIEVLLFSYFRSARFDDSL